MCRLIREGLLARLLFIVLLFLSIDASAESQTKFLLEWRLEGNQSLTYKKTITKTFRPLFINDDYKPQLNQEFIDTLGERYLGQELTPITRQL